MKKNGKNGKNGAPKVGAPMQDEILVLGGRRFVLSARASFRQDTRVMELAEKSGLAGYLVEMAAKPDKLADPGMVRALVLQAYSKGTLFHLMAASMREESQEKWTEASANEVAEFLAELTDPEDKARLSDAILGILLGFFAAARLGSAASQPSATTPKSEPGTTTTSSTGPTAAPSLAASGPA